MEEELQTTLFIRHPDKRIELSAEGKIYYNAFAKCLDELEQAKTQCLELNNKTITIKLGYVSGWTIPDDILEKFDRFTADNRNTAIDLECYKPAELVARMQSHELDACITFEHTIKDSPTIIKERILDLQKVLIYPNSIKNDVSKGITKADIYDQTFYLFDKSMQPSIENDLRSFFSDMSVTPKIKIVPNQETMISSVENGKGVAIMDIWSQPVFSSKISWIPIPGCHHVVLAWHKKGYSAEISKLCKILRVSEGEK